MAIPATVTAPRVWVGCLACYNSGRLVGHWFDCTEAADVDLTAVHAPGQPRPDCEELWCFDLDGLPIHRELDLLEAAEWGAIFEEVGEDHWPALCAWVESGSYTAQGRGDLPVLSDFEEVYTGHWPSFEYYARELAADTDMMRGWPEVAIQYFGWDDWISDLAHDYTVVAAGAPDYGVHVFRSL